jgi:hypothetical protein
VVAHGAACQGTLGDRIVRLVYADEAGIGSQDKEPFLVVASIVVDADKQLQKIEDHLDVLIEKHIPERLRHNFVFHAMEIFNGGKNFKRYNAEFIGPPEWPLNRRLEIAHDLAQIPSLFSLPICVGFIDRAGDDFELPPDLQKLPDGRLVFHHTAAFLTCSMFVEQWMRERFPDEIALMIVEDKAIYFDQTESKYFPFIKIKEDPLFQPKRRSSVLQIADFCAYIFKRYLMNQKEGLYLQFLGLFQDNIVRFDEA